MSSGMFHLYFSNRLERLLDQLVRRVGSGPGDVFRRDTILVQSRGMERWLSLELAGRLGIWAGAEFPFPQTFTWSLFKAALPRVPEESAFDRQNLMWLVMRRLPEFLDRPEFLAVRRYLERRDDDVKRYQLARRIADLFDQYVIFRPDMVTRWEKGLDRESIQPDLFEGRPENAAWQEMLWRDLVREEGRDHRAALQERYVRSRRIAASAPERLFLFGLSTLPPYYLDVLRHLAPHTEIHLFCLNPCREFWTDLRSRRFIRRLARRGEDVEALHFEEGNPLLASLGAQGGEFLNGLYSLEGVEDHVDFEAPGEDTTLHRLQTDLLELRGRDEEGYAVDDSMQFHSCHSAEREVEVLKDRLLDLFESRPDLEPHDVIVLAPEIENYAQAIEAVFDTDLPFAISDRSARVTNAAGEALLGLIDLVGSRFEASRVLEFLEHPLVARRFRLDERDLLLVRHWVETLRIRWGRDADHREQLGLGRDAVHTWRHALDRLLLGYALGDGDEAYGDHWPAADAEGQAAEVLGQLSSCLRDISALATTSGRRRTAAEWERALLGLLRGPDPDSELARDWREVAACFEALREQHRVAGFEEPLRLEVMRHWLEDELAESRSEAPFLGGGITCCNLLPMRSIPFRVVCLLGMNDGDYPRSQRPLGFDLMVSERRAGDRSRRDDDRYLLLETLLSAREVFYVSWVGRSLRDDQARPPSVLVSELLDYLGDEARERVVQHPLQPFSPRYFDGRDPRLFSYDADHLAAAELVARPPSVEEEPRFRLRGAAPLEEVELEEFCRFFRSPAAWFFRHRAETRWVNPRERVEDRVEAVPGPLAAYAIRNEFLRLGEGAEEALRLRGLLPPGKIGRVFARRVREEVEEFRAALAPLREGEPETVEIDETVAELRIVGRIEEVFPDHALTARMGRLRAVDQYGIWIRHLLLNLNRWIASVGLGRSPNPRPWTLQPQTPEMARGHLETLVAAFREGQSAPLPFFPDTAQRYMREIGRGRPELEALQSAAFTWRGWTGMVGECDKEPVYRWLYDGEEPLDEAFVETTRRLALPGWGGGS